MESRVRGRTQGLDLGVTTPTVPLSPGVGEDMNTEKAF